MTQLVNKKCGYRVTKFKLNDAENLMNVVDPIIVQASMTHGIAFYEQMIFDATNTRTKKATLKNINSYPNLPCVKNINSTDSTYSSSGKQLGFIKPKKLNLIV